MQIVLNPKPTKTQAILNPNHKPTQTQIILIFNPNSPKLKSFSPYTIILPERHELDRKGDLE